MHPLDPTSVPGNRAFIAAKRSRLPTGYLSLMPLHGSLALCFGKIPENAS